MSEMWGRLYLRVIDRICKQHMTHRMRETTMCVFTNEKRVVASGKRLVVSGSRLWSAVSSIAVCVCVWEWVSGGRQATGRLRFCQALPVAELRCIPAEVRERGDHIAGPSVLGAHQWRPHDLLCVCVCVCVAAMGKGDATPRNII